MHKIEKMGKVMNYKQKYKQLHKFISDLYPYMSEYCKEKVEGFFPELKENEDKWIKREIINYLKEKDDYRSCWIAWLENQCQVKKSTISQHEIETYKESNNFSTSEDERIRKDIIDLLCNLASTHYLLLSKKEFDERIAWLEKQGDKNPTWSEEDMNNLDNIIWLCDNSIKNIEYTWIPSQASKIKSLIERIKDNIQL